MNDTDTNVAPHEENDFNLPGMEKVPVAPAHAIAAIALNMALKFHDINTIQDGVLYQQYKMEGKNVHGLHLDHVFDTALQIERHLMTSANRLSSLVYGVILDGVEEDLENARLQDEAESADSEVAPSENPTDD